MHLRIAALATLLLPFTALAEPSAEYAQVRKIALRDRRVQETFAKANERLDAKIVELDPALAGYVRLHPASGGAPDRREAVALPKSKPRTTSSAPMRSHVVQPGETLSGIAAQYGVSSENLQATNRIRDARKLKVGEKLAIPASH